MPNAFTLFGRIEVDTRRFERELHDAEVRLNTTERAVQDLERHAHSLGRVTAVTGRQFEKMSESVRENRQRMEQAIDAYRRGDVSQAKFASALRQTDARITSVNSRLRDMSARLQDAANRSSATAGSLSLLRSGFAAIGVSGVAAAYGIGRAAIEVDNLRNQLRAATGSTEAASAKMDELNKIAAKTPGMLASTAIQTYALMKPMGIAEDTINNLIQSFGRIKLATPNADMAQFAFNLNQIASTMDKTDFKQAIENFPRFGEIIKNAFKLESAKDDIEGLLEELRKLREAGKLTKEQFMQGFAEAVNADDSLSKLEDTLGTKIEKLTERLSRKVAPMGHAVIDSFLRGLDDFEQLPSLGELEAQLQARGSSVIREFGIGVLNGTATTGNAVADAMIATATKAALKVEEVASKGWYEAGKNIILGFYEGLASLHGQIIGYAVSMATSVTAAVQGALQIKSPSKVFFAIGKDVAQGFIDGLNAMRAAVGDTAASVFDISKIKLGKESAKGVELLTQLIGEIARFNVKTKEQEVALTLTGKAYEKLNAEVKEKIKLAARELDQMEKRQELLSLEADLLRQLQGPQSIFAETQAKLANGLAAANEPLAKRILLLAKLNDLAKAPGILAGEGFDPFAGRSGTGLTPDADSEANRTKAIEDARNLAAGIPPPPFKPWQDFWNYLNFSLKQFTDSLPTMKEAIGVNLVDSISRIGDVFGQAVAQWDGTAKGFFRSLAEGFRSMIQQIIAELIRLMVIKTIMNLVGGAFGGLRGSGASLGGSMGGAGLGALGGRGLANGGFVSGPGSSTSDSIPAMLSNGEYVINAKATKKLGTGFLDALNNSFRVPTMAFAGGGMVGGSSAGTSYNYSNSFSPSVVINVQGNATREQAQQTGRMFQREIMQAMEREKFRNK